jgi:hypothetical protein
LLFPAKRPLETVFTAVPAIPGVETPNTELFAVENEDGLSKIEELPVEVVWLLCAWGAPNTELDPGELPSEKRPALEGFLGGGKLDIVFSTFGVSVDVAGDVAPQPGGNSGRPPVVFLGFGVLKIEGVVAPIAEP